MMIQDIFPLRWENHGFVKNFDDMVKEFSYDVMPKDAARIAMYFKNGNSICKAKRLSDAKWPPATG